MFCLKLAKIMLVVRTLELKMCKTQYFSCFIIIKTCKEHIKYRYEYKYSRNALYTKSQNKPSPIYRPNHCSRFLTTNLFLKGFWPTHWLILKMLKNNLLYIFVQPKYVFRENLAELDSVICVLEALDLKIFYLNYSFGFMQTCRAHFLSNATEPRTLQTDLNEFGTEGNT